MSIAGHWTLFYDWNSTGNYSSTSITLNANGSFSDGQGHSGTWAQVAGMLLFQFSTVKTTYGGNWADKVVVGIMSTFGGLNGSFYMIETSAPVAAKEILAKGAKNAAGQ